MEWVVGKEMDECHPVTKESKLLSVSLSFSLSPFRTHILAFIPSSSTSRELIEVFFPHGQIMELETRNSQLTEELSLAPSKRPSASSLDWTPRAPARHILSGHRSPITRVTFHPLFSLVVSASEDSSMKVYDWETGEFERTVKGHTKAVQDLDFDQKGNFLGKTSSVSPLHPIPLVPLLS